ncbi:hypothetical protein F66182_7289 [Fusarium sp. NRRL 66182]|nr:hypothetical protein F66182_7289 [Fusarium sp. NRRL 66182]
MSVLIVLTLHIPKQSSGRTLSQVSVALEVISLVALGWFLSTHVSTPFRRWSTRCLGVDYGVSLLVILFATVATVATLIQFSKSTLNEEDELLKSKKSSFLAGLSVALGLSFALQTGFLLTHFFHARKSDDKSFSLHTLEEDRDAPSFRSKSSFKSLRYSQTIPYNDSAPRMMNSMDSRTPPSSIGGRSRSGTANSIKFPFPNTLRSTSSKTQLSSSEKRRPLSVESINYRSSEDAFDTWDTSSVDTHNRQVVMEATTPPQQAQPHFLETIPGSPTPSRTSSPDKDIFDMPLEPPRLRMRSRSYSPVPTPREQLTPQPSMSELHIHPLFRSDSPTPPPMATPGTVVVASPNAGQVISQRQSVRSLRAASNPVLPSPLSHRGSLEIRKQRDEQESIREEQEAETDSVASSERPLTPPIPEWVMGAGARSSWTDYNSRKTKIDSDIKGEAKKVDEE